MRLVGEETLLRARAASGMLCAPWLRSGRFARPVALPWLKRCKRPSFAAAAGSKRALGDDSRRRWCSAVSEGGTKWIKPPGRETGIRIYNSLSRSKEPLILGNADVVTWYSCGPTVYDHAHLGHACSYVNFDIIRRIITKMFGKVVVMVMGITDIDDKIIKRANEMNVSPVSLARFYEEDFKQDMEALKVLPPTIYMRVTENIPQIIAFIQQLVTNGHGYSTSKGNVYFDICSWGDRYGKLRNIYLDAQEELVDSDKRHMKDFALWKAAKPEEMCWESPWGKGRPGWHIECSTISSLVFGQHLDIHTGGIDLAFPHHENEIAQCEAYHQCQQWGNYFLHAGHLHVKGSVKMSKSLKNYITIKDFLQKSSPNQFRMFCLRSGYRSAIEYNEETLNDAKNVLHTISSFVSNATAYMKGQLNCEAIREDVLWERLSHTKAIVKGACADDFDTSRAVGAITDLVRHGNRQLKAVTKEAGSPRSAVVFGAIISYIQEFLNTTGITLDEGQVALERKHSAMLSSVIDELVNFRIKVRDFALAIPETTGVPAEGTVLSKETKQQQKAEKRQLLQERQPLLQACDRLRQDLAVYGINIKDRSTTSNWELGQPIKEPEKS
ncbi:probable cysteine--tRNA ligase, mitochondrial isoform X2 [Sphaerodactylus townsendi]|uniref:probable cysteine--tRNA ligase, mitochondrial isoform X2 n=1 Tax=Sphaerodactylus townsendi TaxID=933632 RepID=UPI0020272617|nr:probable cysteine--tRNA ligase, mitochondrial isoform X2 [Sphaerodactylus townsendi]